MGECGKLGQNVCAYVVKRDAWPQQDVTCLSIGSSVVLENGRDSTVIVGTMIEEYYR